MILYGHLFSSYTWKALIALYEKHVDFTFRSVDPDHPEHGEELRAHWPIGKFPLLVDEGRALFEATIIIEYLDRHYPQGPELVPADPEAALMVRHFDRIFDNHVMTPTTDMVLDAIRGADGHVPAIIAKSKETLDNAYGWLETHLADEWATVHGFTLADCAAAPSLFYADWAHPIDPRFARLRAYRARLLARPSVVRCVEDARPFRVYFPLGAPDRD